MKHYYAVVDTNVIVSALIAKKPESPPRQVFWAMLSGEFIPLYHPDILAEYGEGKSIYRTDICKVHGSGSCSCRYINRPDKREKVA